MPNFAILALYQSLCVYACMSKSEIIGQNFVIFSSGMNKIILTFTILIILIKISQSLGKTTRNRGGGKILGRNTVRAYT